MSTIFFTRRRAQVHREGNDLENEEEGVLDSLGEDDGGGGRERTTVSARFEGFLVTRTRLDEPRGGVGDPLGRRGSRIGTSRRTISSGRDDNDSERVGSRLWK